MTMNSDRTRLTRPSSATIRFVSLGLIFATLIALGAVGYFTERGISISRDWVVHAYQVRSQLNDLELQITRVQVRENNSLLSKHYVGMAEMHEQFVAALRRVQTLRPLTADNPRQQERLDQIAKSLNAVLAASAADSASRTNQASLHAKEQELLQGQKHVDAVVHAMQDEEESILEQKLHDWDYLFKRNIIMLGLAFAVVALVLVYNIRELMAEVSHRKREEEHIRENANSYRVMSAKILELQDLERRRIARELHDSVGQYLAGLKISLSQIKPNGRVDPVALVRDTIQMTDCALQEVRTISHLLHPPLLEELGFLPAARWYLDEYGKRSQMKVSFAVDGCIERLPREVEIALFRVLQESLTNVYRHAAAQSVNVRLASYKRDVTLTIADDGRGIPVEILSRFNNGSAPGIGLGGMRERLAEFGGVIHVDSSVGGSVIRATIPIAVNCKPVRNGTMPEAGRPSAKQN